MAEKPVKDLMVPLSDYVTVGVNATLFEAVQALEKAQANNEKGRHPHRAVLILDANKNVVGKLSHHDIMRALEPKYDHLELTRFGYSRKFMESLLEKYQLWEDSLDDICRKANEKKVVNFMAKPTEAELINESAPLNLAIHQLLMGCHQSLLVMRADQVIGVLRLTDVFQEISRMMKECKL
ncbi:MAG: CBS domain-containing protein [Desulfobacterales bacterium]|jgi:CBS domain containing-hemolysin-like protein|nr:CBS domain-containing protein [Desulfobacterales bacterium]